MKYGLSFPAEIYFLKRLCHIDIINGCKVMAIIITDFPHRKILSSLQ